jgi:hypothetical protein
MMGGAGYPAPARIRHPKHGVLHNRDKTPVNAL